MAYIFCALIVYVLWWNKPFGPEQPIVVQGSGVEPVSQLSRAQMMKWEEIIEILWINEPDSIWNIKSQLMFYSTATIFSGIHRMYCSIFEGLRIAISLFKNMLISFKCWPGTGDSQTRRLRCLGEFAP